MPSPPLRGAAIGEECRRLKEIPITLIRPLPDGCCQEALDCVWCGCAECEPRQSAARSARPCLELHDEGGAMLHTAASVTPGFIETICLSKNELRAQVVDT